MSALALCFVVFAVSQSLTVVLTVSYPVYADTSNEDIIIANNRIAYSTLGTQATVRMHDL